MSVLALALLAAALLVGTPEPRRPRPRRTLPGGSRDGRRPDLTGVRARLAAAIPVRRRDEVDVGALVGEVAALLRTGLLPQEAWERACRRRPATARAMARAVRPTASAWWAPGARVDPAVRAATDGTRAALRLAAEVGAPPADVLDQCVLALTEAAAAESARAAALAGPRSTARLLGVLPLVGAALGVGIGADPVAVFTDGAWGTGCLVVGLTLALAGHRWVARELSRARRA